jgi:hypothetical protein
MTSAHHRRILAVDIRVSRFGYAVFETPAHLLETRGTRFASPESAAARLAALCKMFRPSLIVFRKESTRRGRSYPRANTVRRALHSEAARQLVPITFVSEREVRKCFGLDRAATKHEVASVLSKWFPELEWELPRRRKSWQHEPWAYALFEAVALGVTHICRNAEWGVVPPIGANKQNPFAGPSGGVARI